MHFIKNNSRLIALSIGLLCCVVGIGAAVTVTAQNTAVPNLSATTPINYQSLAPIGVGSEVIPTTNLAAFLKGVFRFGIALAAVLAIIMIVLGGVQYMSTDAWTGQKEGKKRIGEAVTGLILVILSWLILNTVNPDLLNLNLALQAPETVSNNEVGMCGYTVGNCELAQNEQYPARFKIMYTLAGGTAQPDYRGVAGDCNKYVEGRCVEAKLPEVGNCAGKLAFWRNREPDKVTGCYIDDDRIIGGKKGHVCVQYEIGPVGNRRKISSCAPVKRMGYDVDRNTFNQNLQACKDIRRYYLEDAGARKNEGYVSECYIDESTVFGTFSVDVALVKNGPVTVHRGEGRYTAEQNGYNSAFSEPTINQNSPQCQDLMNAKMAVGNCVVNVESFRQSPGHFCAEVTIGGQKFYDCPNDNDSLIPLQELKQCEVMKNRWLTRKVKCP